MVNAALTIEPMHRFVRRQTRTIGAALVLVLVGTLSATCVLQAEMSTAEMACCATMSADCGSAMGQDHQCCRTTSVRTDPLFGAATRLELAAPAPTPVAVLAATSHESGSLSVPPSTQLSDASPPGATHPTYLVLSVFRI